MKQFHHSTGTGDSEKYKELSKLLKREVNAETKIVLSINRYERKKNIKLAIEAFKSYQEIQTLDSQGP